MARRHQSNTLLDNLKDYIVPIIGILLVLFLMYSFFFSGSDKKVEDIENRVGVEIALDTTDTKAKVIYPKGKDAEVTTETQLYKGEKIVVSEGRLKIKDGDTYIFNVDKLGELSYLGDKKFKISSGKIWLDTKEDMQVDMEYLKAKVSKDSHLSFIQNEVVSTVYVIAGKVEITTNAGKKVLLSSQEKIEVARKDSANEEFDVALEKEGIDDIFKASEWYLINDGESYIDKKEEETDSQETKEEGEKSKESTPSSTSSTTYVTFNNLVDGANASGSPINIYGTIASDEVKKIVVNNTNISKIIKENKTFSIEGVELGEKMNDLVFKVYGAGNKELEKFVYTVYNKSAKKATKIPTKQTVTTNNFSADAGDFVFTAPSTDGVYTTSEDLVTVKGRVNAKNITKVTVNGYRLKSFKGSSWLYHANKDFGNMKDGTNQYEIKYYAGDKVAYKNYFTIVKKQKVEVE